MVTYTNPLIHLMSAVMQDAFAPSRTCRSACVGKKSAGGAQADSAAYPHVAAGSCQFKCGGGASASAQEKLNL